MKKYILAICAIGTIFGTTYGMNVEQNLQQAIADLTRYQTYDVFEEAKELELVENANKASKAFEHAEEDVLFATQQAARDYQQEYEQELAANRAMDEEYME